MRKENGSYSELVGSLTKPADFLRVAALIGAGASLLTACQEAGVVHAASPTETQPKPTESAPTPEPSPTPESAPAALLEQMPLLMEHGYSLQQGERGWELISPQNQVVLVTSDTLTITAQAREGEILILPAESFKVRETIGVGVPIVLTFKDTTNEGETAHIYLDRIGEWVSPVELQSNPRETNSYTHTTLEDFLSGRVLYSELLETEAFPAEAVRPDRYEYVTYPGGRITEYGVMLHAVINGYRDEDTFNWQFDTVNITNDYIRQAFFYTLDTPEGVRAVIATQQQNMPDGQVLSLHTSYGPDNPLSGESVRTGHGVNFNLLNSVFLARTQEPPAGFWGYTTVPVIHEERRSNYDDVDWSPWRPNMGAREVRNLSLIPENNLMNVDSLGTQIRQAWEQSQGVIPTGQELGEIQFRVISVSIRQGIPSSYYHP